MATNQKIAKVSPPALKKLGLVLAGAIVVLLIIANLSLWTGNLLAQHQRYPIEREISYWENIVRQTPTYRDGYLKLASLYWQLHQNQKLQTALQKAREIDPNYQVTKQLEKELQK